MPDLFAAHRAPLPSLQGLPYLLFKGSLTFSSIREGIREGLSFFMNIKKT
jgi:hypothetical protein